MFDYLSDLDRKSREPPWDYAVKYGLPVAEGSSKIIMIDLPSMLHTNNYINHRSSNKIQHPDELLAFETGITRVYNECSLPAASLLVFLLAILIFN